jgi:hypothetical protein
MAMIHNKETADFDSSPDVGRGGVGCLFAYYGRLSYNNSNIINNYYNTRTFSV